MKTKVYDCVEMKRRGAQKVIKDLEKLGAEEQLSYWKKAREEMLARKGRRAS